MKVCPQCERQYGDDVQYCAHDGATLRELDGADKDPMIGRVLDGRWRIEEKLGEGGMGAIYLASQQSVGRQVAIKTLRTALSDSEEFVDRFMQEARVTTTISHPHCVTILDFGKTDNGLLYLAMELLEGEPLSERLRRGRLPLEQSLQIGMQVASALAAAHDHNIIHRDLKPENIFVLDITDDSTFIKVLDFGISKDLDDDQGMTKTGQLFGTPQYMSPEQCRGEDLDGRSDIYSLGCILYELISGRPPFQSDKSMNILVAHVQEEIPPLEAITDRPLPRGVASTVMAMLSKEPADRPATAKAVRSRLETLLSQFDTSQSPQPRDADGLGSAQTLAAPEETSPVASDSAGGDGSVPPPSVDDDLGGTSGSKVLVVIGLLGVLFFLGIGVVGAGYWWYSTRGGDGLMAAADEDATARITGRDAVGTTEVASADTASGVPEEAVAAKDDSSDTAAQSKGSTGAPGSADKGGGPAPRDDEGEEPDPSDPVAESGTEEEPPAQEPPTEPPPTEQPPQEAPESEQPADPTPRPDPDPEDDPEPAPQPEPAAQPEPAGPAPADFISSRNVQAAGSACNARDVRQSLDTVTTAIGRCAANHSDALPGSVMLDWTILTEGDPMDVSIIKSDLSAGAIERCIVKTVGGVRFSPLGGGRCYTRVTYRFRKP
jgi:serine/threonine-protein kinase